MSHINIEDKIRDANLLKKYHKSLIHDYTEYPTKNKWIDTFRSDEYKNSLKDWLGRNSDEPILFYIHTPFCEQLCWFCLCSKEITQDYSKVKKYLYDYLFKEIDMLFNFLQKNNLKLNVKEIYFGGGSPTYYNNEDFENLMNKLKQSFDFSKVGDCTVEIDPRRVDEEKLLFYKKCGVNRISIGVQDFDRKVQERINRIQPPELLDSLLTKKVRQEYPVFNFDILVGLPGQTTEGMAKTMDKVIELRPTQLQTMMLHYKPNTRKYMINMLRDGPLPDFYDRKILYKVLDDKLTKAGYKRTGYESYALPGDPIEKSYNEKKTLYASLGSQKGEAINFVAVGSSGHGSLGNEYYSQNFYEQNLYRDALDNNQFPIHKGIKLDKNDQIRRDVVKTLRTYFEIDFREFEEKFDIDFKSYFKKSFEYLKDHLNDGLITIDENKLKITELGFQFSSVICFAFDDKNH